MNKTKAQKGITLIALIITIVVLLILAAVAISSITNDGILSYAQNAAKDYNQAVKNEQSMLQEYEDYLTGINGGFEAYTVGQEVTIGGETFYVIKDSPKTESKVLLLAKENIDTTNLVQSSSAEPVAFSSTNYWSTIEGITYPYDLVETGVPDSTHYAAYAAYQYGVKLGGTGRLLTYSEADKLDNDNYNYAMIYGDSTNGYLEYWLGSAYYADYVWYVDGDCGEFYGNAYDDDSCCGVRPVVEISKSSKSIVSAE